MSILNIIQEQMEAQKARENHAVVTIVETDGSTPRSSGKMIVFENGSAKGTVGGGAIEALAKRDAVACIKEGSNAFRHYDLNSEASNTGMTCGGAMSVLIEVYRTNPLLVMCGAGHVGGSLIQVAKLVGFDVLLIDNRPEEAIAHNIALADQFLPVDDFEQGIQKAHIEPGAYYVIATYGHSHDGAALSGALTKHGAYVGMIGSSIKIKALFEKLRQQGVSDKELASVYTPIGLDLGGETPAEISISIMSEILMIKNGRTGKHLAGCEV